MAKKTTTDSKTLELIQEVKKRKEEIASAERPNWKTNCSFPHDGTSASTNIHVESSIYNLVSIVAFLRSKEVAYKEAADHLGVDAPAFSWGNSSVSDWVDDIKTRINKIQIVTKKKKLEALESRLNLIISPELRAQLELEAIEAELS